MALDQTLVDSLAGASFTSDSAQYFANEAARKIDQVVNEQTQIVANVEATLRANWAKATSEDVAARVATEVERRAPHRAAALMIVLKQLGDLYAALSPSVEGEESTELESLWGDVESSLQEAIADGAEAAIALGVRME